MRNEEKLLNLLSSIYRHWTWSDRQKELFEYYLQKDYPDISRNFEFDEAFFASSMVTCMCIWYGLLYVTCDGINSYLKKKVEDIAPEYIKIRKILYDFRNATFHVQPKYWSCKLMNVLKEEHTADIIRTVHKKVGVWLEEQLTSLTENILSKNK